MANNFQVTNEQLFNLLEGLQKQVNKLTEQKDWPIGARNAPRVETLHLTNDLTLSTASNYISNEFNASIYDYFVPLVLTNATDAQVAQSYVYVEIFSGNDWVIQRELWLQAGYNVIDYDFSYWNSVTTGFKAWGAPPTISSYNSDGGNTFMFPFAGQDTIPGLAARTRIRVAAPTADTIKDIVIFGKINA